MSPPSHLRLDAMGCDRSVHPARQIGQSKVIGSSDTPGPRGNGHRKIKVKIN